MRRHGVATCLYGRYIYVSWSSCSFGRSNCICVQRPSTRRQTCNFFHSLSSKYGNYSIGRSGGRLSLTSTSRSGVWISRSGGMISDKYRLKLSKDRKKWWDDQSDEYRLKWSDDRKKWWDDSLTSTSWKNGARIGRSGGMRMGRDGGTNGLTRTSWSGVRISRSGGTISLTRTSWSGVRISRIGGKISLKSTRWSGVRMHDHMTYEKKFRVIRRRNLLRYWWSKWGWYVYPHHWNIWYQWPEFFKEGQEEKWKNGYDEVPYDGDHRWTPPPKVLYRTQTCTCQKWSPYMNCRECLGYR